MNYVWHDDSDITYSIVNWVIASSEEECKKVLAEHWGRSVEAMPRFGWYRQEEAPDMEPQYLGNSRSCPVFRGPDGKKLELKKFKFVAEGHSGVFECDEEVLGTVEAYTADEAVSRLKQQRRDINLQWKDSACTMLLSAARKVSVEVE